MIYEHDCYNVRCFDNLIEINIKNILDFYINVIY